MSAMLVNAAIAGGLAAATGTPTRPEPPVLVQRLDQVPEMPPPTPTPPPPETAPTPAVADPAEILPDPVPPPPAAPALPALDLAAEAGPGALMLPALEPALAPLALPTAIAAGATPRSDGSASGIGQAATVVGLASAGVEQPGFDEAPQLLSTVDPQRYYPRAAAARAISGATRLRLRIDETGAVRNAEILASTPPDVFDTAALRLARDLRYQPARRNGGPVACRYELELTWTTQ
jgi:protein TonB